MTVSAFDHSVLSGLLGNEQAAALFTAEAEIAAMLRFEAALAEAEAEAGLIPHEAASAISAAVATFQPDVAALKDATARDGVIVPELVRQLRVHAGPPHGAHLHFGGTSQDAIDTGLILRLRPFCDDLGNGLAGLDEALRQLSERFGANILTGFTRMQPALPITAADRIASWRSPVARHRYRLTEFRAGLLLVQFGGAAGTLDKLGDKGPLVRKALAARLGLGDAPQWQSQRDGLADFANLLSLITGSLGKFGEDVALMAFRGDEIALSGGGGSSAMAHKQNPVNAEALVALARFNAGLVGMMHGALVHENERSGAAWTLEWLVFPQMCVAAAAAVRLATKLVGQVERLGR